MGSLPDFQALSDLEAMGAKADALAPNGEPVALDRIFSLPMHELVNELRGLGVTLEPNLPRRQLLERFFSWARDQQRLLIDRGLLDLNDDGYGFLVHASDNYRLLAESVLIPPSLVRRYGLKRGHLIEAVAAAPGERERCPAALKILHVMGGQPEEIANLTPFEDLVPYYPTQRLFLEVPQTEPSTKVDVSMRAVDILTPIGLGQRGLIVAPPRTGKTVLLQGIANSIAKNNPQAYLIVLLIDERPEEVTDFRRNVRGEVVSSTFDETPESHVHAAEMVIEKARRLVETGRHVVILLDSITRLARAYNALAANTGKIMSGGIESNALQKPKRFFGAARNIEGAGSLTVMGSALVDTGSRMDEVIFEEFKGTGNMELHLDRDLVNKRIFPALNFERSGTRKEELLYHPDEATKVVVLRRIMQGVPPAEAMEMLIQRLKKTRSNAEFLISLNR
jgi:transcription termination factor Rho